MNANSFLKSLRTINVFRTLINPSTVNPILTKSPAFLQSQVTRNLWHITSISHNRQGCLQNVSSSTCCSTSRTCGAHTKAEKELVEFLTEEILAERKIQKTKTIPTDLEGFKAKLNGAEVTLTKTATDETINITFNINHTVDTDVESELSPNMDKPELGELKSKPAFKVEIKRENTTLNLMCSFVNPGEDEGEYNDIFVIDEISIYEGDWNEHVYAVSGEVVDSYLYDLIMNYLEEKGISNDFVEKMSAYSTAFEHSAYIGLLESLSKFVSTK